VHTFEIQNPENGLLSIWNNPQNEQGVYFYQMQITKMNGEVLYKNGNITLLH